MKLTFGCMLIVIILVIPAVLCGEIQAQDCKAEKPAVTWKSPDSFFTVEVPKPLELEDPSYPPTTLYGTVVGDCVFAVFVVRLPPDERKGSFSDKIDGLEFIIGGDDDHDFSKEIIKVQKFKAKKIVYAKQNTQGLLIDAGRYVFVLGFKSKNRANLNSSEAKRFFESFRIATTIIDL